MADIDNDNLEVFNNAAQHRFELKVGNQVAVLEYQLREASIDLTHTEVPREFEGHGIGGKLARVALEFAKAEGLTVRASCPYVASYIQRHPEYESLTHRDTDTSTD